jgi:hypothetical protein
MRHFFGRRNLWLSLIFASGLAMVLSCGGDDVTNSVEFTPGRYLGLYTIVKYEGTIISETYMDTLEFDFAAYSGTDTLWTYYANDSVDHYLCQIKGTFVFANDSLKIVELISNRGNKICNPDLGPEGEYRYYVQGDIIYFKTAVVDNYERMIELWSKID